MSTALVTGATSGIGRAIALALHGAGYEVTALGRDAAALDELAARGISPLPCDLSDPEASAAALEGRAFDILANNAGFMPQMGDFCDMPTAEIDRGLAVNLASVLHATRAIVPGMRARGRGHVFFTGSTAGHAPAAGMALYCATKAAIGAFAQALRLDLSPHGLRVTEIVAGRVESGFYKDLLSAEARAAMYAGAVAVQPEDVAAMALAVLNLPANADVARFDILPTRPTTPVAAPKPNGDSVSSLT